MKRIIFMLLIACSTIITAQAEQSANAPKRPENVIKTLRNIIDEFGQKEGQTYAVNKNPNTGIVESSTRVVTFTCSAVELETIDWAFEKDEPLAYQFLHLTPGSKELFSLKVITNDGREGKMVSIRTNFTQEMWLMCCKNPENPQLRDAYAIKWELSSNGKTAVGNVYMITSLRPDLYERRAGADAKVQEADTVVVDMMPSDSDVWIDALGPEQRAQLEMKGNANNAISDLIAQTYATAMESLQKHKGMIGPDETIVMDVTYEQLYDLNKKLDKGIEDVLKFAVAYNMPKEGMMDLYREILNKYTGQNQALTMLMSANAAQTKLVKKTQKYVQMATAKYIKEMNNLMQQK